MPKGKVIKKPSVKDTFFLGKIVSRVPGRNISFIKSRNKYCFRFELIFQAGVSKIIQRGGFPTRKAALLARDQAILQISQKQFVPYFYTVKEFYDYWLWYYMWDEKDISYNTYMSYRNIVLNYIIPVIGTIFLPSLKREDFLPILLEISSPNIRKIALKIAAEVGRRKRAEGQKHPAKKQATTQIYSAEQLKYLQDICRHEEPALYLPLLLTTATGIRISELRALKYKNIDFLNKYASIETQLGRTKSADPNKDNQEMMLQEKRLKTTYSRRQVVLPDYILAEIRLERQRYEQKRAEEPDFYDLGYICCRKNGKPYGENFYKKPYKRLLKKCGFEKIDWRKLRNSNATMLANEKVSMKTIAKNLGHSSPDFTNTVYVEHRPLIYDISKIMEEYVSFFDLLPKSLGEIRPVYILPDDVVYMNYLENKK